MQELSLALKNPIHRELVIVRWNDKIMTAVYENDKLSDMIIDEENHSILGNIYTGKVQNIVKNINAAFVEFEKGQCGYYSLNENKHHIYLNQKKNDNMACGDEILVQVSKEPQKMKAATLTSQINLSGNYLVLTANKSAVFVSSKIASPQESARLKAAVEAYVTERYGFIVRTNAQGIEEEALQQEAIQLGHRYDEILKRARYSTCFARIFAGLPAYLKYIQANPSIAKVTTDIPEVYRHLQEGIAEMGLDIPIILYEDDSWPLMKLKSIPTHVERALLPQVWLKSGGFLLIQPTEAMVIIDVNTGRYAGKKTTAETYFKINMEAAAEIARQLRIRNLSGIVLIDFIDMKDAKMRQQLMEALKGYVQRDSVKTTVVDMTKLNLVEMTRKKERRPLHEYLTQSCPICHGRGFLYDIKSSLDGFSSVKGDLQ